MECTLLAQGQPEDVHAERQDAGAEEEPPERDADGAKLTKKARAALLKAAEKERAARRASATERMDPEARAVPWPSNVGLRHVALVAVASPCSLH